VVKYFLHVEVLKGYHINPERIAVSGDSAGGNLAAAVAQQVKSKKKSLLLKSELYFMYSSNV